MVKFAYFWNLPKMSSSLMAKVYFPQIDFMIFRNLIIHVSSAANLVS